jgi:carbon dioxide concentrating mechanism protein CcmM
MVVRSAVADDLRSTPGHRAGLGFTPRSQAKSQTAREQNMDATATVHPGVSLKGDVRLGANVSIAAGVSIHAESSAFRVGSGSAIQAGVILKGMTPGQVLGDDRSPYAIWIGENAVITHMALIHGPAYIGDRTLIGFRSTVFNARIGPGCIVMMHALIQDVEIPANKYVASGSVITSQAQADRLPDVGAADRQFALQVAGAQSPFALAQPPTCDWPPQSSHSPQYQSASSTSERNPTGQSPMATQLDSTVTAQVRQLLAQGYQVGTEHANARRFQTSSWTSCAPIRATRESEVMNQLESCLVEHSGDYVRLIGINPKAKSRVMETIIQRPDGVTTVQASRTAAVPTNSHSSNGSARAAAGSFGGGIAGQIRQMLSQGLKVRAEYADQRRFQTSSWQTCGLTESTREGDILAALEACMNQHQGEFVRLIGIDAKAKRRVAEVIVQRPGGPVAEFGATSGGHASGNNHSGGGSSNTVAVGNAQMSADAVSQVRQVLAKGGQISTEYADERRFKTSSWQSGGVIKSTREGDVMNAIAAVLASHPTGYVRVVGVDTKAKRRILELMVQRPQKSN